MKKRLFGFVVFCVLISIIFTIGIAAEKSGYTVDASGNATNIKYTLTDDGILTFEIDASATANVQTTVITNRDPVDGSKANWQVCQTTYKDAVKIIIGDGITEANGFANLKKLTQVEIPTSLVTIGNAAFEMCNALESIYVRGTEPKAGVFDVVNITKFGSCCFDACSKLVTANLNPNLTGDIPWEFIKNAWSFKEITIPEGIANIYDGSFPQTNRFTTLTILGMNTNLQSDKIFEGNQYFPAIKAKAGSKAETFAKTYGFTFIDLDTGVVTEGTKPVYVEKTPDVSGGDSETTTPGTSENGEFDPDKATDYGHLTKMYNGKQIVDTWWAFYEETKTLHFYTNTTGYNETGGLVDCDEEYGKWSEHIPNIEHVVVGDGIGKVTYQALIDHTALKDVKLGKDVWAIDDGAFLGCTSLTTIWKDGGEKIEGRADLSNISTLNSIMSRTAVREVVIQQDIKELNCALSLSVETIYASKITDQLIEYAKNNLHNLVNIKNPSENYEFYVDVDYSLPSCGPRAVFGFDEATGTLTIYGSGVTDDIVNYYGGGSKNSPWFSIKQQIKHVVIGEQITVLGKYAFTQCENLETVSIPNNPNFKILNNAFEKCTNLRSVYRNGTEAIEGTADLSMLSEIPAWTFSYDYLIANVIFGETIGEISKTAFEESVNLSAIYGVPGSKAEEYAEKNSLEFFDISLGQPSAVKCTIPEETSETETSETLAAVEDTTQSEAVSDTEITSGDAESENAENNETDTETEVVFVDRVDTQNGNTDSSNVTLIIIAVVAVVAVAMVIAIIIINKKKKGKK